MKKKHYRRQLWRNMQRSQNHGWAAYIDTTNSISFPLPYINDGLRVRLRVRFHTTGNFVLCGRWRTGSTNLAEFNGWVITYESGGFVFAIQRDDTTAIVSAKRNVAQALNHWFTIEAGYWGGALRIGVDGVWVTTPYTGNIRNTNTGFAMGRLTGVETIRLNGYLSHVEIWDGKSLELKAKLDTQEGVRELDFSGYGRHGAWVGLKEGSRYNGSDVPPFLD